MDPISDYTDDAQRLDTAAFAERYGELFLLKPPTSGDDAWDADLNYQTVALSTVAVSSEDLSQDPLFERSWRVAQLRKRPGNPFPDRISLGRARNCDVVVRLPHVSKLHAHFVRRPNGKFQLTDLGSSNGTRVNGLRVKKGVMVSVEPGDELVFGKLTVHLVSVAELHRRLNGK